METMRFHITQMDLFFEAYSFFLYFVVPMINLTSIRNCNRSVKETYYHQGPSFWSFLTFYFPMICYNFSSFHEDYT